MKESGDYGPPTTTDECRLCGEQPARGVSWVDQCVVYWKCDYCSNTQHEGVLEEVNREQIERLRSIDRSQENRMRFLKERLTRMEENLKNVKEKPGEDIVKRLWDDAEILYHDTQENVDDDDKSRTMAERITKRIHALT